MKLAAYSTLVVFSATLLAGIGHFVGVALAALARNPFVYDFRFYSVLLIGSLLVVPSLVALRQVPGLGRGERRAWKLARLMSGLMFAVNVPLIPTELRFFPYASMQDAGNFVAFGSLVALVAAISWVNLTATGAAFREPDPE